MEQLEADLPTRKGYITHLEGLQRTQRYTNERLSSIEVRISNLEGRMGDVERRLGALEESFNRMLGVMETMANHLEAIINQQTGDNRR